MQFRISKLSFSSGFNLLILATPIEALEVDFSSIVKKKATPMDALDEILKWDLQLPLHHECKNWAFSLVHNIFGNTSGKHVRESCPSMRSHCN